MYMDKHQNLRQALQKQALQNKQAFADRLRNYFQKIAYSTIPQTPVRSTVNPKNPFQRTPVNRQQVGSPGKDTTKLTDKLYVAMSRTPKAGDGRRTRGGGSSLTSDALGW